MARFPGAFTGRINKPSLPRSNTFNGPPRSKPSRRHQSSGKIVWRFSVKVMVVTFMVIIHYLKPAVCQGFCGIYLQKLTLHFVQCLRKTCGLFRQTLQLQMKNKKHRRATMQVVLVIHHTLPAKAKRPTKSFRSPLPIRNRRRLATKAALPGGELAGGGSENGYAALVAPISGWRKVFCDGSNGAGDTVRVLQALFAELCRSSAE